MSNQFWTNIPFDGPFLLNGVTPEYSEVCEITGVFFFLYMGIKHSYTAVVKAMTLKLMLDS